MLVQHPTPPQIDYEAALLEIDPDKDVDGMHPLNLGRLALSVPGPVPCTPAGIEALLAYYEIPVAGREVCILGRGFTLGRPLALLLSQKRPDRQRRGHRRAHRRPRLAPLHPAGRHRGRGRGRARHPPARAPHPRGRRGRRRRPLRGPQAPPRRRRALRGGRGLRSPRASAASARPRSRCCSATSSRRPSGEPGSTA